MDQEYLILCGAVCDAIEKLETINTLLHAESISEIVEDLKKASQAAEDYYICR